MKPKPISLYPLKFKDVLKDVLQIKPEPKQKPKPKAKRLDLLYDLKLDGEIPRVVAGPTFFAVPIDAKQGFADTVNCFLTIGQPLYINFEILDYQTGKSVGSYRNGELKMK